MRYLMTLLIWLSVASAALCGPMASLTSNMEWTGEPTSDGSQTFPAMVLLNFAEDYQTATAQLGSTKYSGTWELERFDMTSPTQQFYTSEDGEFFVGLSPATELDDVTIHGLTDLEMTWAHPDFNEGAAPQSFLYMSGKPLITIPEPAALLLVLVGLSIFLVLPR